MSFSTRECAWKHTTVKILTRTLVGIQAFEFEKDIDKDYLRGAGAKPIDIQSGNESYKGSLTLLKYELDMLNDAAVQAGYGDIGDVPHEAVVITCTFKKNQTDPFRTITAVGVAFTNLKQAMSQGDKQMPVQLPFLCMEIK